MACGDSHLRAFLYSVHDLSLLYLWDTHLQKSKQVGFHSNKKVQSSQREGTDGHLENVCIKEALGVFPLHRFNGQVVKSMYSYDKGKASLIGYTWLHWGITQGFS
jgi:hypothetical protein